jgi:membrane protease YdiL (CAAX protease family)
MVEEKSTWYKSSSITAPILVIIVLVMLRLSSYVLQSQKNTQSNIFLVISIVQIIVLVLPCIFYYFIKERRLSAPVFMSAVKPSHIIFIIFTLLLFISGSVLIKYIYVINGSPGTSISGFFDTVTDRKDISNIGIIISFIAVPAVCEEFLFRGLILSEYRSLGSVNAVIISALCFAMLHCSIENFPIYFFAGIVLGFVTVVTRSIISSIIIHLISNALSIYGSDVFLSIIIQKSGKYFVLFLILVVFGLSLLFVFSKLEQIYFTYADKPPITTLPPKSFPNISKVFLSPSFIILAAVFILITVLK